jgi:subtilase family serine protease
MDLAALPTEVAAQTVTPAFHMAPALLDEPDNTDLAGDSASAQLRPHSQQIPGELRALSTRQLTPQGIAAFRRVQSTGIQYVEDSAGLAPLATSSTVVTYTPAQIRAAYGMSALPTAGTSLTATQAAQLGAGQTIYIIAAYHDPNVASELAAFNAKFALPTCTTKAIASTTSLPLTAASTSACEFSVVYATAAGAMTATAPAYNSGWATEIALDVQWAHATAPLARIVLVESPDAALSSLIGTIKVANAMGPGVVSMSFGASEGSWTSSVDSAFTGTNMTYLAATGDSGAGVSWPAVSSKVLAVGGTRLTYSGSSARSEVSWSGTGGGTSAYTATPSYQTNSVPGMGTVARRTVADVAFNADPTTGQYVAVQSSGSSTVSWVSAGGTSLSTPQWAGLIAVANASRAAASQPPIGLPHPLLYTQISTVPGSYAAAFADITQGSNGTCTTCSARSGYDTPSGLGTPNVSSLINHLTGGTSTPSAPAVTSASISGSAGVALSFQVAITSLNPVTYSLSGAPSGMSIGSTGIVSWAKPVAGSYSVIVTVKDTKTGLTGQATYTILISSATGPAISAAGSTGVAGRPLTGSIGITDVGASYINIAIANAPLGMQFSLSGQTVQYSWASPVAGKYTLYLTAVDSAGLSAKASVPITITAK